MKNKTSKIKKNKYTLRVGVFLVFAISFSIFQSFNSQSSIPFAHAQSASSQFTESQTIAVPDTISPSVPTNLNAVPVSQSEIDLSWNPSTDNVAVGGYVVFRDSLAVATTTDITFADTLLTASTTYTYTVEAFDTSYNYSALSATVSTSTLPIPIIPPTPTSTPTSTPPTSGQGGTSSASSLIYDVHTTADSGNAVVSFMTVLPAQSTVSWGLSPNYEIGSISNVLSDTSHQVTLSGLTAETHYYVQISATAANGAQSTFTTEFTTAGLPGTPLPNPSNFVAQVQPAHAGTSASVVLSWTNTTDPRATEVRIVRSETFYPSDQFDGVPVYEGPGQSFRDANVTAGKTYYYAIFSEGITTAEGKLFSSGVLAKARIPLPGEIVSFATSTNPFAGITFAQNVNPMIAGLTLADFQFIQESKQLSVAGNNIIGVNGQENLTIRLPYNKVPQILKTIAITLNDPTDPSKAFIFLLRANADQTYYEASIGPLGRTGIFPLTITILDYQNQGLKQLSGSLAALAIGAYPSQSFNTSWLWLGLALLIILLIIASIWNRRRKDGKVTGNPVIPAKAGIQGETLDSGSNTLDSRLHGNDKFRPSASLLSSFLLFALCSLLFVSTSHASYNPEINYQGKLANASNIAVADGQYPIIFNLYTTSTGGSSVWTETDYGANQVTVKNGLFSIMLGSTTPFTGIDFNQTYYLGVTVASNTEMTPRKIIGAVPAAFYAATSTYATTAATSTYATNAATSTYSTSSGTSTISLSANTLQNLTPGQFFRSDINNATSSATTSLSILQTGAGKIAEFFGTAGQSVLSLLSNGNVGIGSSTPSNRLEVSGNTFLGGNVTATGTLAVTSTTTTGGLSIGSLSGFLKATAGAISTSLVNLSADITGVLGISNGGTGTSTAPGLNQLLIGNGTGGYNYIATTSLGDNYFSNSGATTTLNTGTILSATTGTFGTVNATSTTATSTFGGGLRAAALSVSGNLYLPGLCVTGDTKLRRRRRKGNGKKSKIPNPKLQVPNKLQISNSKEDDQYIYDDVMIKDVEAGDEIQTLDTKTGKLVWSKVKQLAYMGKKPIFKLTTASGKTIRTTGNHPYFVLGPSNKLLLALCSGKYYEKNDSNYQETGKNNFIWLHVYNYVTNLVNNLLGLFGGKQDKANHADSQNGPDNIKVNQSVVDITHDIYSLANNKPIPQNTNETINPDTANDQLIILPSSGPMKSDAKNTNPMSRMISESATGFNTERSILEHDSKNSEFVKNSVVDNKNGAWRKVVDIKVGQSIAIADQSGKDGAWDKIVAIESMSAEDVYDIEVEGTHNFIGNGIVAHNTAFGPMLVDASGNVSNAAYLAVANGGTGQTSYTDGQLLIGNTATGGLTRANLSGTTGGVTVTNANGSITLTTSQLIGTASSPQFAGLSVTSTTTTGGLSVASLSGLLFGTSGAVSATTSISNSYLTNSTISGISLGSNLATLSTDSTLSMVGGYNGSTTRTVGLNLGNANTWTALQTFNNGIISTASSTFTNLVVGLSTTTNSTSTNLFATNASLTNATTTNLFSTTASSTNLFASIASLGSLNVSGATTLATSLNGFIQATNGLISATTSPSINALSGILAVGNGGTGLSSASTSAFFLTNSSGVPFWGTTTPAFTLGGTITGNNQNIIGLNQLTVTGTTATSTFSTGGFTIGTSQFVVQQSTGNVGIGTTTPVNALTVLSTTQPQFRLAYDGANYLTAGVDSGGGTILKLNGATGGLMITNPQPAAVSSVVGTTATTSLLVVGATGGDVTGYSGISAYAGYGGGISLTGGTGGTVTTGGASFSNGGSGGSLSFLGGNGASVSQSGTWDISGMGGNISLQGGTGGTSSGGSTNSDGAGGYMYLYGGSGGTNSGNGGKVFIAGGKLGGTGVNGDLYLGTYMNYGGTLSSQGNVIFGNNQAIFNTTTGDLGIGTTGPLSALQVANTAGLSWGYNAAQGAVTIGDASSANGSSLFVRTPSLSSDWPSGLGVDGSYVSTPTSISTVNLKAFGVKYANYGSNLAFSVSNGTSLNEAMRIDKSGNVGIGTTSPTNRLEVAGNTFLGGNVTATGTLAVTSTTTTGGLSVGSLSGLLWGTSGAVSAVSTSSLGLLGTGTAAATYVPYTGATTGVDLGSQTLTTTGQTSLGNASTTSFTSTGATYLATLGGNVGIGTTNPGQKLEVNGSIFANANLAIVKVGATNQVLLQGDYPGRGDLVAGGYMSSDTGGFNVIPSGSNGASGAKVVFGYYNGVAFKSALEYANTTGSANSNLILMKGGGNVGIGTVSPNTTLDVTGANQALGGAWTSYGNLFVESNTAYGADVGGSIALGGMDNTTGYVPSVFGKIHGNKSNATIGDPTGYLAFETANYSGGLSEKMRITSTGNVGIGTTSPLNKLDVNGGVAIGTYAGSAGVSNGLVVSGAVGIGYLSPGTAALAINGNVGIGTTSPSNKLEVAGNGYFSGNLTTSFITATSTTATSTFGSVYFNTGTLSPTTGIKIITTGTGSDAGKIQFGDGSGWKLHIGGPTADALSILDNGSVSFSNPSFNGMTFSDSSPHHYWNYGTGGWDLNMLPNTGATPTMVLKYNGGGTGAGDAYFNGNVGIGTTSPLNKLEVAGNGYFAGNLTTSSITSTSTATSTFGGNISPSVDNAYSLGSSVTNRWSAIWAQSSHVGDLVFGNNFRILEAPATSSIQAMIWRNQNGQDILNLDQNGNLNLTGDICANNVTCYGKSIAGLTSQVNSLISSNASSSSSYGILSSNLASSSQTINSLALAIDSTNANLQSLASSTAGLVLQLNGLDSRLRGNDIQSMLASSTADVLASSTPSFIARIANVVIDYIQSTASLVFTKITSTLAIFTNVQTQSIETQTASVTNGIEMTDSATGQVYCLRITNGDFAKVAGKCGEVASTTPISIPVMAPSTPVIVTPDVPVVAPTTTPVVPTQPIVEPVIPPIATSTVPDATSTPPIASSTIPIVVAPVATSTPPVSSPAPEVQPVATSTAPVASPEVPAPTVDATPVINTPAPTPTPVKTPAPASPDSSTEVTPTP